MGRPGPSSPGQGVTQSRPSWSWVLIPTPVTKNQEGGAAWDLWARRQEEGEAVELEFQGREHPGKRRGVLPNRWPGRGREAPQRRADSFFFGTGD